MRSKPRTQPLSNSPQSSWKGRIDDADFHVVTDAGFTPGEAGEIVAHVALTIFTNYFNNVANTEIDFPRVDLTKAA
jgi:alkylhydroperoxidase family enzyme